MQYLLTQEELDALREEGRSSGFSQGYHNGKRDTELEVRKTEQFLATAIGMLAHGDIKIETLVRGTGLATPVIYVPRPMVGASYSLETWHDEVTDTIRYAA